MLRFFHFKLFNYCVMISKPFFYFILIFNG